MGKLELDIALYTPIRRACLLEINGVSVMWHIPGGKQRAVVLLDGTSEGKVWSMKRVRDGLESASMYCRDKWRGW